MDSSELLPIDLSRRSDLDQENPVLTELRRVDPRDLNGECVVGGVITPAGLGIAFSGLMTAQTNLEDIAHHIQPVSEAVVKAMEFGGAGLAATGIALFVHGWHRRKKEINSPDYPG